MVRGLQVPACMPDCKPRILLADDDPELLTEVAEVLEADAIVTRAASGAELMMRLGEDPPYDLVVTDISMPWMTGLQAIQSVRYAGLDTPVVVITALRDEGLAERVGVLGARVVLLRKPFDETALKTAVANAIHGCVA